MVYAGVVLEFNGKYLLQLRDNKLGILNPGKWVLFGGGVEIGEKPEDAAIREIKEEIGLKITKEKLRFLINYGENYIYIYTFDSSPKIKLMEGVEAQFFTKTEIINLRNLAPLMKELFIHLGELTKST